MKYLPGSILILLIALTASAQDGGEDDPLPLRRLMIPPQRLADELERTKQGVLVQAPLKEFDDLVREAAHVKKTGRPTPRLLKARYTAELAGNNITAGSGQWTIDNPRAERSLLPLGQFNLALSKIEHASAGPALLGDFDGKNLALLVDGEGSQEYLFDWTLRGSSVPGGIQFQLQLPTCPTSLVELTVPADQVLYADGKGFLLSGPFDGDSPLKKIWRIQQSGKAQVAFTVRSLAGSEGIPTLQIAQAYTAQTITPERVQADAKFQIEVLHHPVRQFQFECDASLQPFEVSCSQVEIKAWRWQPPPVSDSPGKDQPLGVLIVDLREPFQGSLNEFRIRSLAQKSSDGLWISPLVRMREALPHGETMQIVIHPDVQLEKWDPGQFRLLSSSADKDGLQTLTLVDPRSGSSAQRRPTALFRSQGIDLHLDQKFWWLIDPKGTTLTVDTNYDLIRGSLFQLAMKLPKGGKNWIVEQVEMEPKELLRSWVTAGPLILVDLQRGISPRSSARLIVRMRSLDEPGSGKMVHDFPDLEPTEPAVREGVVYVGATPHVQIAVQNASAPAMPTTVLAPWGMPALLAFPFRDQPVFGKVRAIQQPAPLQLFSKSEVLLTPGGGSLKAQVELDHQGELPWLDVNLSEPTRLQASSDRTPIRSVERLPLWSVLPQLLAFNSRAPWSLASTLSATANLERWRIHFTRPLVGRDRIRLDASFAPQGNHWSIPLASFPQAGQSEDDLLLQTAGLSVQQVASAGLRRSGPDLSSGMLHLHNEARMIPRLAITTRALPSDRFLEAQPDNLLWTTRVSSDGPLVHHVQFATGAWVEPTIPVILPGKDVRFLGAKLNHHWLEHLKVQPGEAETILQIPLSNSASSQTVEVFYTTPSDWSAWPRLQSIQTPMPIVPGKPLLVDRRWRLAPGLSPVEREAWKQTRLPNGKMIAAGDLLRAGWTVGDRWLDLVASRPDREQLRATEQILLAAESGLRKKLIRQASFGESIEKLAMEHLKDQLALVVDAEGLRAAGWTPGTLLPQTLTSIPTNGPRPYWESLGLVMVVRPGAAVLTSRDQWEAWVRQPGFDAERLDEPIRQAIAFGQDSLGLVHSVTRWLESGANTQPFASAAQVRGVYGRQLDPGWTEWVGIQSGPTVGITIFHDSDGLSLGIALALAILVTASILPGWLGAAAIARLGILLSALWGLLIIWLPGPFDRYALLPLGAALLVGLIGWVRGQPRRERSSGKSTHTMRRPASKVIATLLILGAALTGSGHGQAQPDGEPYRVLLLPDASGKPASVLISPELRAKLEALAHPAPEITADAILTAAQYKGKLVGNVAQIEARFDIHCFADRAVVYLPLAGADLREGAFLDGAPVLLAPAPIPQTGYQVVVQGGGSHRLILPLQARISAGGEQQEVRIGIPRVMQSSLLFTLPGSLQEVQLSHCLGEERLVASKNQQEVIASLGRVADIQLRWRPELTPSQGTAVEVKEIYIWDLKSPNISLAAQLQYQISKGTLDQAQVLIPEGVELARVEANIPGSATSRLKRWRLQSKDKVRLLTVDLDSPITNKLVLNLQLIPRVVLEPSTVQLRLPTPLKVKLAGGALAYRLDGWDIPELPGQNLTLTRIRDRADLAKLWQDVHPRDTTVPTRGYSFRREPAPSMLPLALRPYRPQLKQDFEARIQPGFADLRAKLSLQSPDEEISLIEADLPANITLADVVGASVHHWSRQENLVQIWLQQPAKDVSIELVGWTKLAQRPFADKAGRFNLPPWKMQRVISAAGKCKLIAAEGFTLVAEKTRGLETMPGADDGRDLDFSIQEPVFEGSFLLKPVASAQPQARIIASAQLRREQLTYTATIDCLPLRGDLPSATILLREWSGGEPHLDVAVPGARVQRERLGKDYLWKVNLPPSPVRPIRCFLRAQQELRPGESLTLPSVTVPEAQETMQWIGLIGADLKAIKSNKVTLAPEMVGFLGSAEVQPARWWKATDADPMVVVQSQAARTEIPVQWLATEHEALPAATPGQWVHQSRFTLMGAPGAEVHVTLPNGAQFLGAAWGSDWVQPRNQGGTHLWLQLPAQPGVSHLWLRWRFSESEPSLEPRGDSPSIEGIKAPLTSFHVHVPPGLTVAASLASVKGRIESAMRQAKADTQLCALLGEEDKPVLLESQIVALQRSNAWTLRSLEYELPLLARKLALDPDTVQRWKQQLIDLRDLNRQMSSEHKFDSVRQSVAKNPGLPATVTRHPLLQPSDIALRVVFSDEPGHAIWSPQTVLRFVGKDLGFAILATQVLVAMAAILLLIPPLRRWLLALWPELCLAGSIVGTLLMGLSWLGLLLFLTGAMARILWLTRIATHLWNRWRTAHAASEISNASSENLG